MAVRPCDGDDALVRVCDLAGRPRGTGFLADLGGTLLTSHEAVDGLARLVLHAPGDQVCLVGADAITPLPELGLALVATEGISLRPLPVAVSGPAHSERRVRLRARGWTDAVVVGTASVTYTATDRFHLLDEVYELALDSPEVLRVHPQASGSPVIDAETGAVLAVIATALHAGHRAGGFAVPLRAGSGPLAELLARNAATVPAYGPHLNLAGALQLTATSVGSAAVPREWREPVARPGTEDELRDFLSGGGDRGPLVLGLVGDPGCGRTTELAALAARRARGAEPAPTVWLRGAELRPGDGGLKDAVERSLRTAARIVSAAAGDSRGEAPVASPDAVADLARSAGRPLLVLLDGPEEMPPVLAHALPDWTAGTASWLRAGGVRLVVACRPEYWEQAGALFPAGMLHVPEEAPAVPPGAPARALPFCVRLGDLPERQAVRARARYGIPPGALAATDAAHPLALRLFAEIRAALPEPAVPDPVGTPAAEDAVPGRAEIFSAYLDLVCLRIAVRLTAGAESPARGTAVRRLAARVAGQVHEAARRCLGPGQGELDRESFEDLFPWRTGWASAVLTEGLVVPAGAGYRFAHEEFADWLQGLHLDLDEALFALVHRWFAAPAGAAEAPVRLPSRPGARAGHAPGHTVPPAPPVGPAAAPHSLPVPRHRIGPVIQSLLLTARQSGPTALARHLETLIHALDQQAAEPSRLAAPPKPQTPPRTPPWPPVVGEPEGASEGEPDAAAAPAPALMDRLMDRPAFDDPPADEADLDADTVPNRRPGAGRAAVPPPRSPVAPGPAPAAAPEAGPSGESRPPLPAPEAARRADAVWWAAHLLGEVLLRVPDAGQYRGVLRLLAERITVRSIERGGFGPQGLGGLAEFGPWFWRRLELPLGERLDLLRLLLPADGPPSQNPQNPQNPHPQNVHGVPGSPGPAERFLPTVGELLCDAPRAALPVICGWFGDDRPLQTDTALKGPRPTVAAAVQALLHTHRHRAVDDLTEALVEAAHPGADELLAALAEDEPSAVCRAVDRWAHEERPARHVAAAAYGVRAAPYVRSDADRELLRYAALAMLARTEDCTLHGAALALLVRDPATRSRHLPAALTHFAAGDPQLPAGALAAALASHPEPVLAAFQARLREPGAGAGEVLRELAAVTTPALARRAAGLVRDHLRHRPEGAVHAAEFLDRRLEQGASARAVVFPLVVELLREHPPEVRRAVAPVLAAPGSHISRPMRQELLDVALERERDADVLDALLGAAADGCARRPPLLTRDLVHRLGLLLGRTPEGAAHFDRRLVQLAAASPCFARLVRGWLDSDGAWDAVIGPSARRLCEQLAVPSTP
ncbi:serine protease [Streptomyces sp. DSM 41987]|uniref:serine protease n=1 Tax=Streptomyces TaxID=1883 RepID=UPI0018DF5445|nr:serine protease [Streptomyces fildesensis]